MTVPLFVSYFTPDYAIDAFPKEASVGFNFDKTGVPHKLLVFFTKNHEVRYPLGEVSN